ncbi:MBL fold metallo-hydrolase [Nocardioides halotolerans]|uniref:MBL fold metallo-hydrolase n=1 Tax=Nocardioides halotolerans TaxID=433660 RepID=UPI0004067224|nr:MBL fold metallo-hydrolase [Nocardioides halotolerans]
MSEARRNRLAELPAVEQVRDGTWVVPVPIPDNPLHYVLSYVLEADGGLVLVDVGWNDPGSFEALGAGLGEIGASVADVRGMVVTHIHPDHYGLAGRVREVSGAWIALHGLDASQITGRYSKIERLIEDNVLWLTGAGAPAEDVEVLCDAGAELQRYVMVAHPDRVLSDGDRIELGGGRALDVVHTPGHTVGHVCLYDAPARLLFSGDHVLPRISPNVGFHPLSSADPLADFLASLRKVGALGSELALPGHEWRFDDVPARTRELAEHHEARLAEVLVLLARGACTSWEVAQRLIWSRPFDSLAPVTRRAALSEAMAHLVHLRTRGEVRCEPGPPDLWLVGRTGS